MAAPDIPHPARAPHLPQNSAESQNDSDLGASAEAAGGGGAVSAVLLVVSAADSAASFVAVWAGLSAALSANLRDATVLELGMRA